MKTAVLAVLVATDVGLSAEEIALNYDVDQDMVERRLRQLHTLGHVRVDDGRYFAKSNVKPEIVMRSRAKAQD